MTQVDWHPYPEQKPEPYHTYIITIREEGHLITLSDFYYHYGWQFYEDCVVAWAELPEPYDPEGEDDESK